MRVGSLLFAWLTAGLVGCVERPHQADSLEGGRGDASNHSGSTSLELNGRPFDLWKGREAARATVVVFIRTDCPISNRYAPTIRSLCDVYRTRGVDFFLVYENPRETADSIHRHLEAYGYTCPGLHDPRQALAAACDATVTPEAVVFDARRKIAYRGRIDNLYADFGESRTEASTHELADAIEAVVSGRPIAEPVTKAVGCYIADLK